MNRYYPAPRNILRFSPFPGENEGKEEKVWLLLALGGEIIDRGGGGRGGGDREGREIGSVAGEEKDILETS